MSQINVKKQQFEMRDVLYAVNGRHAGPLKAAVVNNWINRGHLPLSEQGEVGQGKFRNYNARDAVFIGALNAASGLGLDLTKARVLLEYFDNRLDAMMFNINADRGELHIFLYRNLKGELTRIVCWEKDEQGNPNDPDIPEYVSTILVINIDRIVGQVIALLMSIIEERELEQKEPWSLESELTEARDTLKSAKLHYAEKSLRRADLEEALLQRYESLEKAYTHTDDDDVREWEMIVGEQGRFRRAIERNQEKVERLMAGENPDVDDDDE
jgi:hypothetical protein